MSPSSVPLNELKSSRVGVSVGWARKEPLRVGVLPNCSWDVLGIVLRAVWGGMGGGLTRAVSAGAQWGPATGARCCTRGLTKETPPPLPHRPLTCGLEVEVGAVPVSLVYRALPLRALMGGSPAAPPPAEDRNVRSPAPEGGFLALAGSRPCMLLHIGQSYKPYKHDP